MIYIHSGTAIDKLINELVEVLEKGDILLDGGNSYWGDSMRRYERLNEKGSLEKVPSYVKDTGEVNWLVDDVMHMEVPVHVIAQSVMQLFASRDENSNQSRAIAMMRHGFGGHPYGPEKSIREGRKKGRVGGFHSK